MKLLITGATGFIGSHLVREAYASGRSVVASGAVNNDSERRRMSELEALPLPLAIGLLQDRAFIRRTIAGCEAVVHLAAAQHEANVPDEYFERVNVEATRVLLEESARAGVKRFIYGSSIGVYGGSDSHALTEDSPVSPQNVYGATKWAAEKLVMSFADRIEVTIVRISETYGPGDLRLLKLFRAVERGLLPVIGAAANMRQPIHVHDLARGLLKALDHTSAVNQTFILAGSTPVSTRETIDAIAAAMQRRPLVVRLPLAATRFAATLAETVCKPLGIQPPLHRRRLDFFVKSYWFNTQKAKRLLGFEPTISFGAGLRDTVSWYRAAGLLAPVRRAQYAKLEIERHSAMPDNSPDVPLAAFAEHMDLSHVLEYTHDAIIIWEMDGAGILYWNRAAEQLYGYSRQEAYGRVTHLLLHTQTEGGVDDLEERVCRYGVWLGHLRHRKRDGSAVVVDARLALMAQGNGRWLVLEINREVSTTREFENPLTRLTKA